MKGKEIFAVLFPLFSALLVWPLFTVANRPALPHHGGSLSARSVLGQGRCFLVTLPLEAR